MIKRKIPLLVVYDYKMEPWTDRLPFSPTYLLHKALEKEFEVYTLNDIGHQRCEIVLNMLPLGRNHHLFTKRKLTLLYNITPKENILREFAQLSDIVMVPGASFLDIYGEKGRILLPGVDTSYQEHPFHHTYDIGFLGSEIESWRINILNRLSARFKVLRGKTTLGEESAKLLSQCKLVLSIDDWHERGAGIEYRFFTFGNVRPIIIHRSPDFYPWFEEGEDYIGYENANSCCEMAEYYLDHMEESERLHKKLVTKFKRHTYEHRAGEVLKIIEEFK